MLGLIICGAIGGVMFIMSLILLTGRGSFLVAGYNTMSKSEKERYDAVALSKFVGKILLPMAILTTLVGIESLVELWWFWVIWGISFVGLLVFAIVYANMGNRFKK